MPRSLFFNPIYMCCLALILWFSPVIAAQEIEPEPHQLNFEPNLVTPGFDRPLKLAGEATFIHRFLPLYNCGLYAAGADINAQNLHKEVTAKRLELIWKGRSLKADRLEKYWFESLNSYFSEKYHWQMNAQRINQYARQLAQLPTDKRWVFEYLPDAGTSVYVEGKPAVRIIGTDANRALWQIWLGRDVDTLFKQQLTGQLPAS